MMRVDPANTQVWDAFVAKCDTCGQTFRMSDTEADYIAETGITTLCPDCEPKPLEIVRGEDDATGSF